MKNYLFVLAAVIFNHLAIAQMTDDQVQELIQKGSEQLLVTENSRMIQENLLYQAEIIANKLLTFKPESSNYNYRKGFLLLKIQNDFVNAIPFLEKAVLNTDVNYDAYSVSEKSAPIDAYYHLACCYQMNEEIDKATEYYNKFISSSKSKSENLPLAKLGIVQCQKAKEIITNRTNVTLRNIGSNVNTSYAEYAPLISLDGTSLYFTSGRPWTNGESDSFRNPINNQYPEDVYVSYMNLEDSTWMTPKMLEFCLPKRNEATSAVSTDERRIYLYEDSTGSGDIYYSDFYANKFNNIEKLDLEQINTMYWETHLMVSHDGSRLFFSSDRPGGYGGRDIYMCTRENDTTWSQPVNLGPKVNTSYDEDAPFLSIDNKSLYFASNGDKSIGGFDILVTELMSGDTWTESRNLGYPLNSTTDDIFYTTTIDGLRGFMTSFRKDGYGEKDIYEIRNDYLGVQNIAVFKGKIKTTDGSPLPEDFAINLKISCDDCEEYEKNRVIFPRLKDGLFMTGLKPCKSYRIAYYNASDNATMYEELFSTKCDSTYQEIKRELLLDVLNRRIIIPVDTVKTIDTVVVSAFKNIEFIHYFDYNKNKLSTDRGKLKDFIKDIEKQLNEGRTAITINVYSSASRVPTKIYETNEKLTQIRAENIKYDLIAHFENKEEFKGKVNVVIVSAIVDGPEYVKDFKNQKKYRPYQFVGLKTE